LKLLLIRHGQSVGNAEGRIQGQFDSPLNDRGRDQARALAQRLQREDWPISAIYTSDLKRAAETAEILAARLDLPLIHDVRLREYDIGILSGVVWREVEHLYPDIWRGFQDLSQWTEVPEEEGNEAFHCRLVAALDDIRARHGEDETVALVSHGGSLGMILAHLLGMGIRRPIPFRFGNTSLSVVELHPRGALLVHLNDACHLDGNLR
jgi:broad specificity phosphatase PhoE